MFSNLTVSTSNIRVIWIVAVCVLKGVPIITTGSLKSCKNGNHGMPIFTGCVYFHDNRPLGHALTRAACSCALLLPWIGHTRIVAYKPPIISFSSTTRMDFLQYYHYFIFSLRTSRMSVTMSVTQTNVSVYCTASKITLLQWRMTSGDPPGVIFLEFFCEKMHNGNIYPPTCVV